MEENVKFSAFSWKKMLNFSFFRGKKCILAEILDDKNVWNKRLTS